MRKSGLLSTSAIGSAAIFSLLLGAAPALAQGATTEVAAAATAGSAQENQEDSATASTEQAIIVTGSRIARPTLESAVPITTITADSLTNTGNLSVGDRLNQLPQLRQTFGQANSTRFIGTAGINALDLRGLGTARTLVLVDGRRIITATPGDNRPDVNNVPTDLIERVDIVTGGNSAIYGSDAVAGVVNFIMRRDFEGFMVRGQGGVSSRGDRGSYFVSGIAGWNFADGRANVTVAGEFSHSDTLYNADRDGQTGAFSGRSQFNGTELVGANVNPSAGALRPAEPGTGNGVPDTTFLRNIFNNNISDGGLYTAACPVAAAAGESAVAFAARRAAACSGLPNPSAANALAQFGRTFVFQPDGSLIANPCVADLRPVLSNNCVGGLGSSLRRTGMLSPGNERFAFNLLARYEISEAFEPFLHAQFVRSRSNQEGQPSFFLNTFDINNPFLSTQARAAIQATLAPGVTTFAAQRFNIDFGGRGELHERDTYQLVAGARGTFNDDWRYEVSFNYGRLETFYETQGNLRLAQYANSIDAVRNAAGNIVCRINADATAANDDAACVPVNLFGDGQVSRAALDYFGYTSSRVQEATLSNALAFVSGDSSQLFELPGGPIGFVLGAEWRRETAFAAYDPVTSSGLTNLNILPDFVPPALEVKEAFGEIRIPILSEMPFFHELTVEAAGRFSDYNVGGTGTVFAWNASGTWAPVRDIRFRVGYGRSIRAPTLSNLFGALNQNFLNGLVDPCGQQNINANPNRVRNCAAAGVPTTQTFTVGGATTTEPFTNIPASGIAGFNGSNANLAEEQGESWTLGAVIQPRWIPGLSLTIDYYRINVSNVIFALNSQIIINQCYDDPVGIDNQFCRAIFRNPNGTFAGQSNVTHAGTTVGLTVTGPSFISGPFNFARQITRGIDFDLSYRFNVGDVRMTLRGIASRTLERTNFTDIANPDFGLRQLSVLGDPEWQGQLSANMETGIFNLGYRMRYIGHQVVAVSWETQNSFQGRPPTNPDQFPFVFYPDVMYHDFRLEISPTREFQFHIGVDNALDRLPPFDLLGTADGDPFSPIGRYFYAGARVRF